MDHCLICLITSIVLWLVVFLRTTDGGSVTWFEPPPVEIITDPTATPSVVNRNLTKGFEEKLSWNFSLSVDLTLLIVTVAFKGSAPGSSFADVASYAQSVGSASVQIGFKDRFNVSWIPSTITLTVFNVTTENNGEFECRLFLFDARGTNTWRRKLQVTVLVPPDITNITESQTVKEGETLTLSCAAVGTPKPTITWTRLSDNGVVTNNIWTLTNISRQENGTYRCTADNGVGSPALKDVIITVHFPPNITDISKNQRVDEGDLVALDCTADGNPAPNITWTRLSDNSPVNRLLNISGKEVEGYYRCTADNGIGITDISDVFIYVQNYRPTDTNLTTNLTYNTVVLNEPFNLMCKADANPPAHYRLYKKQQLLTTITDNQAVGTFTTSVGERIKQVTYSCTPNNLFGVGPSDTASVTVHFSPSATSRGRNETVPLGTPVTFTCPVDGNPPPSVKWYKGSEPSGAVLSSRKEFEFTPTSLSDTGLYTCFASNYLGNVSFGLEVVVGPKSTTPPPTLSKERTHSGELPVEKINGNKSEYREEYNDLNNDVTKQLTDPFKKKMDETFANEPNYEKTEVTKLSDKNGSVIVSFNLIFTNPVTTNEAFAKLRSVIVNGTFGPFQVGALTVVPTPTTSPTKPASDADHCDESFFKKEDCSVKLAVAVGISVAAVLLIAIIAVAVGCWIRKERKCRKDIRIAHHPGCEEQRLQGGDPNAQVNNGYAETGPPSANSTEKAAAAVPDYTVVDKSTKKKKKQDEEKPPEYAVEDKSKKKKKNEKVDDTYAKVDMSKKRRKKKPRPGEDVVYADLGDINGTSQMPAVATSPKAQLHPLKRPESYEGTQYADITQFLKGDATLPKDEKQGTEMKEKDENTDRAGGENASKGTLM